ncbi:30S ribosomal protein S14 [Nakamurella sp. A5-74]|uniref:Small ribosomal subunit protein uS14 n=1 Tax=Nakamurella sp. A5-74 TaxID=3158264 RepID=A0AAU8DK42_9ACTN
MAKASKIARNRQRQEVVARYAERRLALKETARTATDPTERDAARTALQQLPRDASPVRVRHRDVADGRPRGYLRKFGVSRIRMRAMAHAGELPGVRKSSW